MIPILKAVAWLATRDTHACVRENKTQDWKWPVCLLLARFWLFRPGYGLSGLCLVFLTLYNLTICEIRVICVQPSNSQQFFWTWFTRESAETVRFHRAERSTEFSRTSELEEIISQQSDCKNENAFENYQLLFGTHNRFYMNESRLKETGQV